MANEAESINRTKQRSGYSKVGREIQTLPRSTANLMCVRVCVYAFMHSLRSLANTLMALITLIGAVRITN